jgi:hypothetical protein
MMRGMCSLRIRFASSGIHLLQSSFSSYKGQAIAVESTCVAIARVVMDVAMVSQHSLRLRSM